MKWMNCVRGSLLSGSAILAVLGTPAQAAAGADKAPAADNAAADTTPTTDSADSGLKEIVVTATKRATDLQTTPIAISVVDQAALQDRHVQSLIDFADGAVPSLRVATFEARQSALTIGIRGIVPFDQNQTARDIGVGTYVDGVYLGRTQGLNAALFDVARIEVEKGPQGTLFGRNTEGGALSIVSAEPTGEFGGRASAGVGNFGSYTGQIHLNLPEFHHISIKLDGVEEHQDATVKNPLDGAYGWNYYDRKGGRVTAVWKPVDGFSVEVSHDQSVDDNTPFYSQLINYNPLGKTVGVFDPTTGKLIAPGAPAGSAACATCIAPLPALLQPTGDHRLSEAPIGVPQQLSTDKTHGTSAVVHYDVTPNLELRSITAWRGVSTDQWDNSGGAARVPFAPNGKFSRYSLSFLRQHQFSQEFQAVGSLPHFDYVVGLYYFNEDVSEFAATPSSNQWNADGSAYTILSETVVGPVTSSNQGWQLGQQFVQRDSRAKAKSYAAFAQATWTPAGLDFAHLTVGGRYTKDKRDGLLFVVQGAPTNYTFNYDKDRFDPMATLAIDVSQNAHLYAKYATGYRAGGANDRSQTFSSFGPESVKSYEVGAKMDFLDHHVRLNVAGYLMDRTGTQIDFDNVDTRQFLADGVTPNPTFNLHTEETRNAPGVSRIRGVEADLTVRPTDRMTVGASYAYTYTHVPLTANPFMNNTPVQVFVVYTPKNAASGYVDYALPVGGQGASLRLHIDGNYSGKDYSFQNENVLADPAFIANGRLALADIPMNEHGQKFTISAWSRNLFNETHIYRRSGANDAVLGDYGNFNPPRTWGLEGTVNF